MKLLAMWFSPCLLKKVEGGQDMRGGGCCGNRRAVSWQSEGVSPASGKAGVRSLALPSSTLLS